jgi:hypothetical protein
MLCRKILTKYPSYLRLHIQGKTVLNANLLGNIKTAGTSKMAERILISMFVVPNEIFISWLNSTSVSN